ncbi:MAG: hypothetical protein QMD85_03285, partial [Candidatus Aenigmarchaeota archaeon]|nr:hypothetical protein [Candidatus Aenigmarchaeota archaeon]MDI6722568.1 hypothetical protein [Candidatus Aenigmarchaeota archaeon]
TKRLVILGDVKHSLAPSFQEGREISDFLSLVKFHNIIVIKGNHDGLIEKIVRVPVRKSIVIKNYSLTHGHRRIITKKKVIIIGHNQPHVRLKDDMGAIYTEPVWIRGMMKNGKELIIMPAFNELCGASVVNENEFIGPLAKNLIPSKTYAYLLDGTNLGAINKLPKFQRNKNLTASSRQAG